MLCWDSVVGNTGASSSKSFSSKVSSIGDGLFQVSSQLGRIEQFWVVSILVTDYKKLKMTLILTHSVLTLGGHGVISSRNALTMSLIVTTLKSGIVAQDDVSVGHFSCNLLIVVSLYSFLPRFEGREGFVSIGEY